MIHKTCIIYDDKIKLVQNNVMSRTYFLYLYTSDITSSPPHYSQATTLCHRNILTFYWAEQSAMRNFTISYKAQLPTHHFRFVGVPFVVAYRTPLSVVKNFNVAYDKRNRGLVHYCFSDRNWINVCQHRRPFAICITDLRTR